MEYADSDFLEAVTVLPVDKCWCLDRMNKMYREIE